MTVSVARRLAFVLAAVIFAILTVAWGGREAGAQVLGNNPEIQGAIRQGLLFLQSGRPERAARAWERAAKATAPRRGQDEFRQAAFLYTLSSIGFTRAKDGRAYEVWAEAVRLYLRGSTTWELEREDLRSRLDDARFLLQGAASTEGAGSSFSESDYLLVTLDEHIGFVKFGGPPPGLDVREKEDLRDLTVSRDFYARPSIVVEQEGQGEDGRSRYLGGDGVGGAISEETDESGLGRSVIPRSGAGLSRSAAPTSPGPARFQLGSRQLGLPGYIAPAGGSPPAAPPLRGVTSSTRGLRAVVPVTPAKVPENTGTNAANSAVPEAAATATDDRANSNSSEAQSDVGRIPLAAPLTSVQNAPLSTPPQGSIPAPASVPEEPSAKAVPPLSAPLSAKVVPQSDGSVPRGRQAAPDDDEEFGAETLSRESAPLLKHGAVADAQVMSLTEEEEQVARRAWQYFVTNRQANTGLFNSVRDYPYSTLWDIGGSIGALVAAEQFKFLDPTSFAEWMGRLLDTIEELPLYNAELPNREYEVRSGKMVDLRNRASAVGSGWSGLDIGRTLVWLRIVHEWYPNYRDQAQRIVDGWNMDRLRRNGEMNRMLRQRAGEDLKQEGRMGYEHYSASGFAAWGYALPNAFDLDDVIDLQIDGVSMPYDPREPSFLTSEPFFLMQLEIGSPPSEMLDIAHQIYLVQKQRWLDQEILTAFSEDSIDRAPWFLYNVLSDGEQLWRCMTHRTKPVRTCQSVSIKTAMAWYALYGDDYTKTLFHDVVGKHHPRFGYYAGIYETGDTNESLNVNTNAVILEAMLYLKRGRKPFLQQDIGFQAFEGSRSRH